MTITLPPSGYMSSSLRTKGEMKTSFEELRDAIAIVDSNADANTTNITLVSSDVDDVVSDLATHVNDEDIHVTIAEKTKLLYAPIYISTQLEFDSVFYGSTLSNSNIYMIYTGTAYLLKNEIPFGSNLKIDSDPGVIVERNGQYRFHSVGTLGNEVKNVHFTDNWSFDGVRATYTYIGDGGFAEISYTENCKFETHVFDCLVDTDGGAYSSVDLSTDKNIIKNISNCEAENTGGAIKNCVNSIISNINSCIALVGGGVHDSDNSNISNITNCTATTSITSGAGVYRCNDSIIFNIYGNNSGSGISECSNSIIFDVHNNTNHGCVSCISCSINNIYDNTVNGCNTCNYSTISNINNNGGAGISYSINSFISNIYSNGVYGCDGCDNSTISNIYSNSDYGVRNSNFSTIDNVYANIFGGVVICDNSTISNVHNNNSIGVNACNYSTIDNIHGNALVGVSTCSYSTISNVYSNTEVGVSACNYSTIDNIHDNGSSGVTTGDYCTISNVYNNLDYGVWRSLFSIISNVHNNYNCGCYECDDCTISHVYTNTGLGILPGGCFECDNSTFLGNFSGNTSASGPNKYIRNSILSIAFVTGDSTDVRISTVRGTINF